MKIRQLSSHTGSNRQRGVTLIEALVALMVMSFGMVALVGLMTNLRRGGDIAKQRGEAMRLAQSELASLRSFAVLEQPNNNTTVSDYENDVETKPRRSVDSENSNTSFTVIRQVTPLITDSSELRGRTVSVTVAWQDRSGQDDAVTLSTIISRTDPAFAGAVSIKPPADGIRMPDARHPAIPVAAKDLNANLSAFRPDRNGQTIWLFNNRTGVIVGKCDKAVDTAVSALTASDVESCKNDTVGYLLSGTIRFSNTDPANSTIPEGSALPVRAVIVGGTYRAAKLDSAGRPKEEEGKVVMEDVSTTPPSHTCFNDSPSSTASTQGFVNYNCIVYPSGSPSTWSGTLQLSGLSIGTTAADYRVCRYSADYNGNGSTLVTNTYAIDNYEHPAVYARVTGSLVRQNFLVVRGGVACPTAPAPNPTRGIFIDYSTIQLQPPLPVAG